LFTSCLPLNDNSSKKTGKEKLLLLENANAMTNPNWRDKRNWRDKQTSGDGEPMAQSTTWTSKHMGESECMQPKAGQLLDLWPIHTHQQILLTSRQNNSRDVEKPSAASESSHSGDEHPPWYSCLPKVFHKTITPNPGMDDFDLLNVVGALQSKIPMASITSYINAYDRKVVRKVINNKIENIPSIFYIVESNEPDLARLWARYGANLDAVHAPSGIPVIAFAALCSAHIKADTTQMIIALLDLGASPASVPSVFYRPYYKDVKGVAESLTDEDKEKYPWCSLSVGKDLETGLHLYNRYALDRAAKLKRSAGGTRIRQVAGIGGADGILRIPHYLIGQDIAAKLLLRKLIAHLALPDGRPLVLVFAGPSGHGKTELARSLGMLLGLDLNIADCAIVDSERDLFGPQSPYEGWEIGSPLNTFLVRNGGKRCCLSRRV
jgi:hypothetical protein